MVACLIHFGLWLSLVERLVRDEEAVGSNPTSPITCHWARHESHRLDTSTFTGFTVIFLPPELRCTFLIIMARFLSETVCILLNQCLRSGSLRRQNNFLRYGFFKEKTQSENLQTQTAQANEREPSQEAFALQVVGRQRGAGCLGTPARYISEE